MSRDNKSSSTPRKVVSLAFFSSALAFASRSVHNTWLEYVMLAAALCLFIICVTILIKDIKNPSK